jgi:hypothetical protein
MTAIWRKTMSKRKLEKVEIADYKGASRETHGCYAVYGFTSEGKFFVWMNLASLAVPLGTAIHTGTPKVRGWGQRKRSLSSAWGKWFLDAVTARITTENLVEAHAEAMAAKARKEEEEANKRRRACRQKAAGPQLYEVLKMVQEAIANGGGPEDLNERIACAVAAAESESDIPGTVDPVKDHQP